MSTWRRNAIEILPQCRQELQASDANLYTVFREMKPFLLRAHIAQNLSLLKKIYAFAEWCMRQKAPHIRNAAGVGFYEHLVDDPETMQAISRWVKKDIYLEIRNLLEYRLGDEEALAALDAEYGIPNQNHLRSAYKRGK
jgi:hypothetical protein